MKRKPAKRRRQADPAGPTTLRIIGGKLRGSKIAWRGEPHTRPMKERTREAIFNLVGPAVKDKIAIDLFAGTGALGFEALSRGAKSAIMIERHFPTAKVIEQNADALSVRERVRIAAADTFFWSKEFFSNDDLAAQQEPLLVFCSPPYDLYIEQNEDMLALIESALTRSPAGSLIVVEADDRFDFSTLTHPTAWDVRRYAPAVVGIVAAVEGTAESI